MNPLASFVWPNDGQTHHVSATFDFTADEVRWYVDGVQVS